VGLFHQNILGSVDGWSNLKTGKQYDLVNDSGTIIAEVKNKHNTVKKSDEISYYRGFDNLVNNKNGKYEGATAYYVRVIPETPVPYNKPFTPSDNEKGKRAPVDEKIRDIDGKSFYAMVTGVEDALEQVHNQIPHAIAKLALLNHNFSNQDISTLRGFFDDAYKVKES
jgi:regulatory protein YycH of two-component signal transduction system YycFG